MRLKNMYLLCKNNIAYFEQPVYEGMQRGQRGYEYYLIIDFSRFLSTVNELHKIECLQTTLENMCDALGDPILHKEKNKIYVENLEEFKNSLKILVGKMQTIIDLGESIGFENIENGFDIKLPSNLSLKELGECIGDVNKAFSQCPLLKVEGEQIQYKSPDIGSFWLEFMIVSSAVGAASVTLLNLAKIVDKCVAIKSHMMMIEKQKKELQSMEMDIKHKESMYEGFKAMQDQFIQKASTELQNETSELEHEDNERLNLSIKLLSEWMSKGLEIHAGLEAPKEIKNYFPEDYKMDFFPKEAVALLSDGDMKNEE